jgi:divalent metal cation (Fe/Co/Zn/Cd) transporter
MPSLRRHARARGVSTTPPQSSPALPLAPGSTPSQRATRDAAWLRAAHRARWLSWFSLVWMVAEGILGLVAGVEAHSIGVISWAIGSAVEGAAAIIVIVRLTGKNRFSDTAELRAQKWVAGSFFVLVPYILYESVSKLIQGSQPQSNWLAVGLLASSIVLMPALGWAKLRLGKRLDSGATAGEGTQNLLCALQGAVGLAGLLLGSAGAGFLDPVAAVVIAGIAAKEGAALWRGEECGCHSTPGLQERSTIDNCVDEDCGAC